MLPYANEPGESGSGTDDSEAPIIDVFNDPPPKRYYPPANLRPLAEPLMIDYDDFAENVLVFGLRFSKLWPNDMEIDSIS